jgi:hypothetical protein
MMDRLDWQVRQANFVKIITDLEALVCPKNRRTPSDLVTTIALYCAEMRKKHGLLESSIYHAEDSMYMVNEAYASLMALAKEIRKV